MGEDDVAMVPVPKEHLGAVYVLLGQLMAEGPAPDAAVDELACPRCGAASYLGAAGGRFHCGECGLVFQGPDESIVVDHENGCWTRQMAHRLRREIGSSITTEALNLIASRSPDVVASDELVSALGVEPNKLRAELGALSKLSRRVFGRRIWPMSARQGWGEGDRMGYRMPPPVAKWWLEPLPEAPAPVTQVHQSSSD